jgi:spore germination cell wall hydrolase CwlJ-like protein
MKLRIWSAALLCYGVAFGLAVANAGQTRMISYSVALPSESVASNDLHLSKQDQRCLAETIYYESRNQPELGQEAVGFVTLNRLAAKKFGNSVCAIVHATVVAIDGTVHCAYSWYCDQKVRATKPGEKQAWNHSVELAQKLGKGEIENFLPGTLYFCEKKTDPKWGPYFIAVVTIQDHIFYTNLLS